MQIYSGLGLILVQTVMMAKSWRFLCFARSVEFCRPTWSTEQLPFFFVSTGRPACMLCRTQGKLGRRRWLFQPEGGDLASGAIPRNRRQRDRKIKRYLDKAHHAFQRPCAAGFSRRGPATTALCCVVARRGSAEARKGGGFCFRWSTACRATWYFDFWRALRKKIGCPFRAGTWDWQTHSAKSHAPLCWRYNMRVVSVSPCLRLNESPFLCLNKLRTRCSEFYPMSTLFRGCSWEWDCGKEGQIMPNHCILAPAFQHIMSDTIATHRMTWHDGCKPWSSGPGTTISGLCFSYDLPMCGCMWNMAQKLASGCVWTQYIQWIHHMSLKLGLLGAKCPPALSTLGMTRYESDDPLPQSSEEPGHWCEFWAFFGAGYFNRLPFHATR